VFPRAAGLREDLDGLGVGAALERPFEHEVEAGEQVLVDELGEELEVAGAVLLRVAD